MAPINRSLATRGTPNQDLAGLEKWSGDTGRDSSNKSNMSSGLRDWMTHPVSPPLSTGMFFPTIPGTFSPPSTARLISKESVRSS